jgi:hypothetical protein
MVALSMNLRERVRKFMVNGLWPNSLETQGSWRMMIPIKLWKDLKLRNVVKNLFRMIDIVINYTSSQLDKALVHKPLLREPMVALSMNFYVSISWKSHFDLEHL